MLSFKMWASGVVNILGDKQNPSEISVQLEALFQLLLLYPPVNLPKICSKKWKDVSCYNQG